MFTNILHICNVDKSNLHVLNNKVFTIISQTKECLMISHNISRPIVMQGIKSSPQTDTRDSWHNDKSFAVKTRKVIRQTDDGCKPMT